MFQGWRYLDESGQASFQAIVAFLQTRLEESETVDWALTLGPEQRVERLAVQHLLESPGINSMPEPWLTVWRLIEESWSAPVYELPRGVGEHEIKSRIKNNDRSGALINKIVELVYPYLQVSPISPWRKLKTIKSGRPKKYYHLVSTELKSGPLIDPEKLNIQSIDDIDFLKSLCSRLESAINHGIELARRLDWKERGGLWELGGISRIKYIDKGSNDPDRYHKGIAPSVKLLFFTFEQLSALSCNDARQFVSKWSAADSDVYKRLWAAAALKPEHVHPKQVQDFFENLPNEQFWNMHSFPEIAELRATRFNEIDSYAQRKIASRTKKGPPKSYFKLKIDEDRIQEATRISAIRELKRIHVAGGKLPNRVEEWLTNQINDYPGLVDMSIDYGFPEGVKVSPYQPQSDVRFDKLKGDKRLLALEKSLSSERQDFNNDPAEVANHWLQQNGNAEKVLSDLEVAENKIDVYRRVWERFTWAHRPDDKQDKTSQAKRVLNLINDLSDDLIMSSIDGIASWFLQWKEEVVNLSLGIEIWFKVIPFAEKYTNINSENELSDKDIPISFSNSPQTITDSLGTPIGKLIEVFVKYWSKLPSNGKLFSRASKERKMRDQLIGTSGRSGLIVRYRLIELLPYFLNTDKKWAHTHLIAPLIKEGDASIALWQGIAHSIHFEPVLRIIGKPMIEMTTNNRLGRETRERLVFSLVIEVMHAYRQKREPVVPKSKIQQMLRTIEDEVRAYAASIVKQYISDMSRENEDMSPEYLFRTAAAPFIEEVWPQERSLATPSVAAAFAEVPATSKNAFHEAVQLLERYLVPFQCWSLHDYGFYEDESVGYTLKNIIVNQEQAEALLKLLNLTIGTDEGSIIPYDLTEALDQIQSISSSINKHPLFRHLSTLARR
jgi:hypothetical protein